MSETTFQERTVDSPLGLLHLVATDEALTRTDFASARGRTPRVGARAIPDRAERHAILDRAERELAAYFTGTLRRFTIPLAPEGTPFQRAVWAALATIPFGETRSYSDVARAVGRPRAVRAVGAANGRNPLALVLPCHRVIGVSGALTGYAGGLDRKEWLLAHERRVGVRRTDGLERSGNDS